MAVGQQAAAGIIALRANDGSYPNPPPPDFFGGTDPGEWRPTSPTSRPSPLFAPMSIPWLGAVTPFTLTSPDQFRAKPQPALTSGRYTKAYKEVKRLGGDVNSERTPEQTQIAYFWAVSPRSSTSGIEPFKKSPLRMSATSAIAPGSSRLASLAGADAAITAWDSKSHYILLAARHGHSGGRPRRQFEARRRHGVAPADRHSELSRLHLGRQQPHRRRDQNTQALFRDGPSSPF